MSTFRVLISGASIAGPALAYWLKRSGINCSITIVERAPALRTAGQGLDIRDTARDIVKQMGIFEKIRERSSHEEGTSIVDGNNRSFAQFAVDNTSGKGDSMTSDVEILRGELSQILYDVTKQDVTYLFGDTISSLQENERGIDVQFTNGLPPATFDLVVAADGLGSKTSRMVFGDDAYRVKSLGCYVSYFSMPIAKTDSKWSRAHWPSGGRNMWLRPDNVGRTRAFLMLRGANESDERLIRLHKVAKEGIGPQKAAIDEFFQDAGWESSRILEGMRTSDDFYLQHVAQVQLDSWSKGRFTVVGDAGYCPSPFTGMGTSFALIGAYLLAGEISRRPNDIPAALESYERYFRPYVESTQSIAPVSRFFLPQSNLGVSILTTFVQIAASALPVLGPLFERLSGYTQYFGSEPFKLPVYEAFKQEEDATTSECDYSHKAC